jgi:hypothetical protein
MSSRPRKRSKRKEPDPTGVTAIDRLAGLSPCRIADYIAGVSAYVCEHGSLAAGPKKAAQIRLSGALSRALASDIEDSLPQLRGKLITEERAVAGALRTTNADVSQTHELDGLRLAVELKPVNLAVGRAIWNRFGDIRTFAVNLHLKFPFAVVGGVLVIPTYEAAKGKPVGEELEEGDEQELGDDEQEDQPPDPVTGRKSTVHLIERAIERLVRAGGRRSEAEAPHLLEGIAVVVYDPDTATISLDLPAPGTGLRWEEFVEALVTAYRARFED